MAESDFGTASCSFAPAVQGSRHCSSRFLSRLQAGEARTPAIAGPEIVLLIP